MHWYIEYHDDQDHGFPDGMAFVTRAPDGGMTFVDFILVADMHRRKGVGTALVEAIRTRWPDAIFTDAISDDGEAFMASPIFGAQP